MARTRRADLFVDLQDDPRENGPTLGDERTTLVEFLRSVRLTLEMKCAGLDADASASNSYVSGCQLPAETDPRGC